MVKKAKKVKKAKNVLDEVPGESILIFEHTKFLVTRCMISRR